MIRDKVIFGGLIGILGNVAMDIFQYPLWKLMIVNHPLAHYASSVLLDLRTIHHTFLGAFISLLADYTYGAFWGIVFVYLIRLTGRRYMLLKGLIFGAFLWLFSFGGVRSLAIVKLREVIPGNVPYYLFFHLVYGLAMGLLMEKFGQKLWEKPDEI